MIAVVVSFGEQDRKITQQGQMNSCWKSNKIFDSDNHVFRRDQISSRVILMYAAYIYTHQHELANMMKDIFSWKNISGKTSCDCQSFPLTLSL